MSDPSPCGAASSDHRSSESPQPAAPRILWTWAITVPPSDIPIAPNRYHGAPTELRNADAVWWHQDTICTATLEAEVYPLFWNHARLGTPEWWHGGPDSGRSAYLMRGMHVVMRPWVGRAPWAPWNTMGQVMEVRY